MRWAILLSVWIALGSCWPMFEVERELDPQIARDVALIGLSDTTNVSTITVQTATRSKEINTVLAFLIFLLTAGTYGLLLRWTAALSNEIVLPSKLLEDNMAATLSLTWPTYFFGPAGAEVDPLQCPRLLVRIKSMHHVQFAEDSPQVGKHLYEAQGSHDLKESSDNDGKAQNFMVFVKIFSPIMKSLVQIAIWNSVSLWLVIVMVVNTLVYNGFVNKNVTNDSIIRLVLVGVYALTNIGHQYRSVVLLCRNITFVTLQTCWVIICKEFILVDNVDYYSFATTELDHSRYQYRNGPLEDGQSDMVLKKFDLALFGTMECSDTYQVLEDSDEISPRHLGTRNAARDFSPWPADDRRRCSLLKAQDKTEKTENKFDKFVKSLYEAEIKTCEKALDSTLEKVLANVAVLLGICLATGLAPWTSTRTLDATGAQLGSYALLLSVSTGLLALVSSVTQLTNATESARMLLTLQEKMIMASQYTRQHADVSEASSVRNEIGFGFSEGIAGQSELTWYGLWRSTSLLGKLPCLIFGPALMLIPHFHRDREGGSGRSPSKILYFKVRDATFGCLAASFSLGFIFRLPWHEEGGQKRET